MFQLPRTNGYKKDDQHFMVGWFNHRRTRATRGLLATGLVIWNRGQVTRPTPEQAPSATLQRHRTRRQDIGRTDLTSTCIQCTLVGF